jgi:hypothetical protein
MLLYSSTINSFIKRLKARSREIVSKEMGLVFHRTRFEWNGTLYPYDIVIFEDEQKLGYFYPPKFQIGINKQLLTKAKAPVIDNVLRHEWAHYMAHIIFGEEEQAHGPRYRQLCQKFGWGEEVYGAKASLQIENLKVQDENEKKVFIKIKKLLALASSSNIYESQAATQKANELLLEYNLEHLELEKNFDIHQEEEVCCMIIIESKRNNAIINAIYEILGHFYVSPVFSRGPKKMNLEIIGNRQNVEMAKYISDFLQEEFSRHWRRSSLKGITQKNSYIKGLAEGFILNLQKKKTVLPKHSKAIISLNQKISHQLKMVYPRLSSVKKNPTSFCQKSAAQGVLDGQKISIRPGIRQEHSVSLLT